MTLSLNFRTLYDEANGAEQMFETNNLNRNLNRIPTGRR